MRTHFLAPVVLGLMLFTSAAQGQTFLGKDARTWQKELDSESETTRRNAAFALGKLGNRGAEAVPMLSKRLGSEKSAKVREAIAFALGDIARESLAVAENADIVPALVQALKDSDYLVRRSAAYALGNLRAGAESAREALESALNDEKAEVRQNVAWALGKLQTPAVVSAIRKALVDKDPLVKRDAANALLDIDPKEIPDAVHDALPELQELCRENNSELRRSALAVLSRIVGPKDTGAAAAIRQALLDPDGEVRCNAALTLANIGGAEAKAALDVLLDTLKKGDSALRRQAAAAISNVGSEAAKLVPDLIAALTDEDAGVRENVVLALGGIGPSAERAIPALVDLLASPKEARDTRVKAGYALSRIGECDAAVKAVPTLLRVLEDPQQDNSVRERVVWALRVHKGALRSIDGIFPAFTKVVSENPTKGNRMLRYDCAYMLGLLQTSDSPKVVMDVLLEFLHDSEIKIFTGVETTGKVGSVEKGSGETTSKDKGEGDGRTMAIQSLRAIGARRVNERQDIVQQLRAIAADNALSPALRTKTKELLQFIGK